MNDIVKQYAGVPQTEKRREVLEPDVFCAKCGDFLGMTCDPFITDCKKCFPDTEGGTA